MTQGQRAQTVPFREALRVWVRVALLSFGGPAGQIAVMHRILVDEKRWISESRFLHALNYCMLLPGPEAQQLATYIGWLLHGWRGGLASGCLFIAPGFLAILGLSILYARYQDVAWVAALFFGLKPAVIAIVAEAVIRIGRKALKNGVMMSIAIAAFLAIFFFEVPFPLIIATAAIIGWLGGRVWTNRFLVVKGHAATAGAGEPVIPDHHLYHQPVTWSRLARVAALCLTLWFAPILLLLATHGPSHVYVQECLFFSKAAVVTFGGAYSVLAYIAQAAVNTYGWLAPGEMLDGLGMAETTPGPLIMVVQFVGFMGAYRHAAGADPLVAGVIGSVLTTWVTFVPCFMWIFAGAPYIEHFRGRAALTTTLSSITAAVVGVIANLAAWFALHTLFAEIGEIRCFGARLLVPDVASIDPASAVIAACAFVALVRFKIGLFPTLAASVAAGMAWHLFLA